MFQVEASGSLVNPEEAAEATSIQFPGAVCFLASVMHCYDQSPVVTYIAFFYGLRPKRFLITAVY